MYKVMLVASLLLGSCWGATPEERARAASVAELDPDLDHGSELYAANCAVCHGACGEGISGPPLADAAEEDTANLVLLLMWGPRDMPSFEGWSDQDLADVVGHVQDLARGCR